MCKIQQQLFCFEIVKRAPSILESEKWADCKFVVGVEPHQVVFGGYKLLMALASPVFEAMFYGSLAETNEIAIPDVEPKIFKAMLQYMYTYNINVSSWSEACQLYYAAEKYMLKQLMEQCCNYLKTTLNVGNVCQIYEHAMFFEDNSLINECKKMFSDDTVALLKNNSFTAANLKTVTTIFSLKTLNLDSELDLIEAAARYVEAQDIKGNEETPVSSGSTTSTDEIDKQLKSGSSKVTAHPRKIGFKANTKRRRGTKRREVSLCKTFLDTEGKQLFRSAVGNIRFLTLTPQQYANCSARKSLLTESEDRAVLLNIATDKSDEPMPSGFSTSRVNRISKTSFFTRIRGLSSRNTLTSEAHYFRKLKWQIKLVSHTYNWQNDSLNFSLLCTNESQSSWSCDASVELRLISHTPGVKPLIFNNQHVFSNLQQSRCTMGERISRNDSNINNYYIKDDCVEMEVVIKVNKLVGV